VSERLVVFEAMNVSTAHPLNRSQHMPRHIAVIMDGNGRWANNRGRPRTFGHASGARAVKRTVEAARRLQIQALTLYAFSSDNWQRPESEVAALMALFRRYLAAETERCVENGIRLSVVGRRDRLGGTLRRAIEASEEATADCRDMHLRVAVDYSARDLILDAASRIRGKFTRENFSEAMAVAAHAPGGVPDVDLLIRTGGEQRLSDFLLWECAYAELVFTPRMWPEFSERDLEAAITEYQRRERRFGDAVDNSPAAAYGSA
jgi:undecaprenyl diphosphate synthase